MQRVRLKKIKSVSISEIVEQILDVEDLKTFLITFTKSNGEERRMRCQKGVKDKLKGGKLNYDPSGKGLLPVFDVDVQDYRMFLLRSVKTFEVVGSYVKYVAKEIGE